MYSLNRLILIDSYKAGTVQEVRLDGHTNLNGVNGAGKTTLLRLIPLFFGERPGRLVPKSRVTDSFAKHYLPNESSYIDLLVEILSKNKITLLSAFPDPDPDVLRLFKNRYQVVGNRELLEMEIDEEYLQGLTQ